MELLQRLRAEKKMTIYRVGLRVRVQSEIPTGYITIFVQHNRPIIKA